MYYLYEYLPEHDTYIIHIVHLHLSLKSNWILNVSNIVYIINTLCKLTFRIILSSQYSF